MNSYLNYNFSFEVDDSDTQFNFNFIEPKPIMSHVLHVVDAVFINLTFTSNLENKFEWQIFGNETNERPVGEHFELLAENEITTGARWFNFAFHNEVRYGA